MKFIIGWLTFKPGLRDDLLAAMQPLVQQIRAEEGCLFFEFNPKIDDPDTGVLAECFTSDAAHRWHKQTPHMQQLFALLGPAIASSDVKVHFADELLEDV